MAAYISPSSQSLLLRRARSSTVRGPKIDHLIVRKRDVGAHLVIMNTSRPESSKRPQGTRRALAPSDLFGRSPNASASCPRWTRGSTVGPPFLGTHAARRRSQKRIYNTRQYFWLISGRKSARVSFPRALCTRIRSVREKRTKNSKERSWARRRGGNDPIC